MLAHIISIGDELLIGDTINTNATWLGGQLWTCGIKVERVITIGDEAAGIDKALDESFKRADVTIITGGLGPTHDDITKKALADYFGVGYRTDDKTLAFIKDSFKKRNIPFTESNNGQAQVPENCRVLFNKVGTAPGMWFEEKGHIIIALPGVPTEMKWLMEEYVLVELNKRMVNQEKSVRRYYHLAGIGESTLSDLYLDKIRAKLNDAVHLAYLPGRHGITLRTSCYAPTKEEAEQKLEIIDKELYQKAGEFIYSSQKDDNLSTVVGRLLTDRKQTVAVAESCTGGFLINSLTNVPGSSNYILGSITAYHNTIKERLLDVDPEVLKKFGAVSKPVALQMAKGIAKKMNTDYGLSTTGIAGPTGGSPQKPVGTVWIGFWSAEEHFAVKLQLYKDRLANKERSAVIALDLLRRRILNIPQMPYELKAEYASV